MIPTLVIAVMAIFGVGIASNTAQPGDTLYPVKVHVTEKMQESLHVTSSGKAAFLASQLDTRLDEASKISTSSPKATDELDAAYSADVKEIGDYISALMAKGDYKTASDLSLMTRGKLGKAEVTVTNPALADLRSRMQSDEATIGKISVMLQAGQDGTNATSTQTGVQASVHVSGDDSDDDRAEVRGTTRTRDSSEDSGGIKEIDDNTNVKVNVGI